MFLFATHQTPQVTDEVPQPRGVTASSFARQIDGHLTGELRKPGEDQHSPPVSEPEGEYVADGKSRRATALFTENDVDLSDGPCVRQPDGDQDALEADRVLNVQEFDIAAQSFDESDKMRVNPSVKLQNRNPSMLNFVSPIMKRADRTEQSGRVHFRDNAKVTKALDETDSHKKTKENLFIFVAEFLERSESFWALTIRPLVVLTSLFEMWSMGIWLGFVMQPKMSNTLQHIAVVDMFCNFLYIGDSSFQLIKCYLNRRHVRVQKQLAKLRRRQSKRIIDRSDTCVERERAAASPTSVLGLSMRGRFQQTIVSAFRNQGKRNDIKIHCDLFLACGMIPVQLLLLHVLRSRRYVPWQVATVISFRFGRVVWAFRDCAKLINQQEREVYVDIRMHGTSGSSWNKARILSKQFFIVLFVGHWLGCLAYALRRWTAFLEIKSRYDPDETRDYFAKFQDQGTINFEVGDVFGSDYILTLYRGLNLNNEDLLPERPIDLAIEVCGSILILLMKSYCIGSFFKYHQKREVEVQRFAKLMRSVHQYLDLYEMPPSLRKTVMGHFRFQQSNHRKIKTLEVIAHLPFEIQKRLKVIEVLPIIVERNLMFFGNGIAKEYCMALAAMVAPKFLQPGEVIFLEAEVPRELIFLDSGAVSFSRSTIQDGRKTERLLRYVRSDRKDDNTMIGGVPLILSCLHFYSARVRAGTEAVVLVAPRASFEKLNADSADQMELLIRNVAEAYLLDVRGHDLASAEKTGEHDSETFASMQQDVRKTLLSRQDCMRTTFTYAAGNGDVKIVQELLQKRVEANVADYDGRSALHVAASEGMSEVLEVLLTSQANPNCRDRWGGTPMQDALRDGFIGAARLLQRHGGRLDLADSAGDLCTYASKGDTIQMQQLLDFKVDPNCCDYDSRTAMHLSASEGHLPVVTFLTSRKADVNVLDRWGNTPLQDAIRNGFTVVARHLNCCGATVTNEFVKTLLCDAASSGNSAFLQMMSETGADMNQGDYDSRTACHLAAAEGQVVVLDYLLNTARTAHSPLDRWGSTPLQDAIHGNHELCVQVLTTAGAVLGPAATKVEIEKAEEVASDLGFGTRANRDNFCEKSGALRRWLVGHLKRVEKGLARSDIFDPEESTRFSHKALLKQVEFMPTLSYKVLDVARLFNMAAEALETTVDMNDLLVSSNAVAQEAHVAAEEADDVVKGHRKSGKDAKDYLFQTVLVKSLPTTKKFSKAMDAVVPQLLQIVDELTRTNPDGGPDLGSVAARIVLQEIGWTPRAEDRFLDSVYIGAHNPDDLVSTLAKRMEEISQVILPGDFTTLQVYQNTLAIGQPCFYSKSISSSAGFNRDLQPVLKWLQRVHAGKRQESKSATAATPKFPERILSSRHRYGSLPLPRREISNIWFPDDEDCISAQEVTSQLVAREIVLLVFTAIALIDWNMDREANVALNNMAEGDQIRKANFVGSDKKPNVVTKSECQRLSAHCWELAKFCRGNHDENKEKTESGDVEGESGPPPIRTAKLLSMYNAISLEDMAVLLDVDGGIDGGVRPNSNREMFATLSPERFMRNMLILMMNHEESQRDVVTAGESVEVPPTSPEELGCDAGIVEDSPAGEQPVPEATPRIPAKFEENVVQEETLSELYAHAFNIQAEMSEGDDVIEHHDPLSRAMVSAGPAEWRASAPEQFLPLPVPFHFRLLKQKLNPHGLANILLKQHLGPRTSCKKLFFWFLSVFCSLCGSEGRSRRRQRRISKRFRELDDDGEGIGTAEMAALIATAFHHSLGQEQELRWAYRVFELLNKADVGDLVTLPELLEMMPTIEEEIKEQQRKTRRTAANNSDTSGTWAITNMFSRLVLPPESTFWIYWDTLKKTIVLYYLVEVPIRFCFLSREEVPHIAQILFDIANAFSDFIMALSVVLSFFRGYVDPNKGVVTVFQQIRLHYVFGSFWLDLIASCPLDLWVPEKENTSGLLMRPRAAVRLLRLLHLRHLFRQGSSLETSDGFFSAALSMVLIILVLVHFLACCWWMIGTRYDGFDQTAHYNSTHFYDKALSKDHGSWTYTYMHRPGETGFTLNDGTTPFWWQYLVSFYWSAGRITGQSSPGNLFAASWIEVCWICTMFVLNVAVNGYCDGILVDKVIAGDEAAIEAKAMRKIVDEYLLNADLPASLISEVKASAEESGKVVERQRMEATIAALPYSLKQRVARRIFLNLFTASDIFCACSESFLVELGTACRILVAGKDSPLAHVGEPAKQLMILNQGCIGLFNTAGNQIAATSSPGEFIGEMPFIFELKYVVYITATEETKMSVLSREDFISACELYPDDAMCLRRASMKAIESATEGIQDDPDKGSVRRTKTSATNFNIEETAESESEISSSVSQTVRVLYANSLKAVVQKLREEQAAARQDMIANFIQAAADGNDEAVENILSKGEVHVDEADYDLRTSLHLAVCGGHMSTVLLLVQRHGAGLHSKDRFNHTPMDDAVREKKTELVKFLKSHGAIYQVDVDVAAQMCQAACDNDLKSLRLSLEEVGVNPNCRDYDKRTALHLAASEGHAAAVQLLLELENIDVSPKDRLGNTPLDDAMRHKNKEAQQLLLNHGALLGDSNLGVVLCQLGYENDLDTLQEYSHSDMDLSQCDYDWRSCLHLAASENHMATVSFLSEARVDVNPIDRFSNTPLDDAFRHGHTAIVAFLRDCGGLSGKDPAMQSRIIDQEDKKLELLARLEWEKIEKEVNNSEVASVFDAMNRIMQHASLEEDIITFSSHTNNFRQLFVRLMRASHHEKKDEVVSGRAESDDVVRLKTQEYQESLMEMALIGMESCACRMQSVFEAEVASWMAGISSRQKMLLNLFAPELFEQIGKIVEWLQVPPRLAKTVRKFVADLNRSGSCAPISLLMHRVVNMPVQVVMRSRVESMALLTAFRPVSTAVRYSTPLARAKAKRRRTHVNDLNLQSPPAYGEGAPSIRPFEIQRRVVGNPVEQMLYDTRELLELHMRRKTEQWIL